VCWLASSMPLERKIEAAAASVPRVGRGPRAADTVSPRLSCAVLQFAANALLRSTPSGAVQSGHSAAVSHKKDHSNPGFLREPLWALVESCLHSAPDQVSSTVSSVGGHLIRPIHAAMAAVITQCKTIVLRDEGANEDAGVHYASLAATVSAVLALLRGTHAASFQPQIPALCSMLASLSADLTALLDGVATKLCGAQGMGKAEGDKEDVENMIAAVHRAAHLVAETISTVALAAGRAPNQRKIFAMAVDDLVAPAALHFRACSNLQNCVKELEERCGRAPRLAEQAAGDGWRVYRKMQVVLGESLFSQEHLPDFALAYSFRTVGTVSAGEGDAAQEGGPGGAGGDDATKGRGKKMKGAVASGYRGEKLKSYQGALFAKLVSLAGGTAAREQSAAAASGKGKGAGGQHGNAGKGGSGGAGSGGGGQILAGEADQRSRGGGGGGGEAREAALMWLPELLRLFVVCGRRSADPSAEAEGLELAFGEQSAGSLMGGSGAGGSRGGGMQAGGGELAGKSKKRKKESESTVGAVAEMDFCRELLHLCDSATGGYMRAHAAAGTAKGPSERKAAGEALPNAQLLLLVRTYSKILQVVVQLDVYRAHVFSEAGEVKPYLRRVVDALVAVSAGSVAPTAAAADDAVDLHPPGASKAPPPPVAQLAAPLLLALAQMLQIDHGAVEPHAQTLCALALRTLRAASPAAPPAPSLQPASAAAAAAERFLSQLSRTMSRLQQGERFVEWLLTAVRRFPAPPVDARVDSTLQALSADLPAAKWGQLPALCERALQDLSTHHLPCALRLRKVDFMAGGKGVGGTSSSGGGDGDGVGEAVTALESLVHVCVVMETLLRGACGKAGGPDSGAMQQLCLRVASQVLVPLLTCCGKSLRDPAPSQSTRIWCVHAGAAILYLHSGLSRLVAAFPSSSTADLGADLADMAAWYRTCKEREALPP